MAVPLFQVTLVTQCFSPETLKGERGPQMAPNYSQLSLYSSLFSKTVLLSHWYQHCWAWLQILGVRFLSLVLVRERERGSGITNRHCFNYNDPTRKDDRNNLQTTTTRVGCQHFVGLLCGLTVAVDFLLSFVFFTTLLCKKLRWRSLLEFFLQVRLVLHCAIVCQAPKTEKHKLHFLTASWLLVSLIILKFSHCQVCALHFSEGFVSSLGSRVHYWWQTLCLLSSVLWN